jgi:hypothetical protein
MTTTATDVDVVAVVNAALEEVRQLAHIELSEGFDLQQQLQAIVFGPIGPAADTAVAACVSSLQ